MVEVDELDDEELEVREGVLEAGVVMLGLGGLSLPGSVLISRKISMRKSKAATSISQLFFFFNENGLTARLTQACGRNDFTGSSDGCRCPDRRGLPRSLLAISDHKEGRFAFSQPQLQLQRQSLQLLRPLESR